jgi:predicted RNA-binding Zn ribbon-like protein
VETSQRDLVLQLLWTRGPEDLIDTPAKLRGWLLGLDLIGEADEVTDEDVRMARHLRAATRSLCAAQVGEPPDARTVAAFEDVSRAAPLAITPAAGGGLDVEPAGTGVARALAIIVAAGYEATLSGAFRRYKLCKGCGWAFFDETKNLSRSWCAMNLCGAKSKMRAYRERKKGDRIAPTPAGD